MLDERDMTTLYGSVKNIIRTTFFIELGGFLLLVIPMINALGMRFEALFSTFFHSVSAFCNAGFSLFTENLVRFTSNIPVNLTVVSLIILGGLGFSVISNLFLTGKKVIGRVFSGRRERIPPLSLNTKAVLLATAILVLSGTLLIYAFEHGNTLISYPLGTQYLVSFFQSVTLRTAGFNTLNFTLLNRFTYLLMMLYMFIGGASGSTAGGVKVNTIALIGGYVKATVRNREEVTLFNQSISPDTINKAFFIIFLYTALLFLGTIVMTITERLDTVSILFEVVSAMGTVGLSAGITSSLSIAGKAVIILLMFIGRVGPLTIFASLSQRKKRYPVAYPQGHIAIG
jgi:trk system potassium uptake protein TrkH